MKRPEIPPDDIQRALRHALDIIRAAGPDGMSDDDAARWAVFSMATFIAKKDEIIVTSRKDVDEMISQAGSGTVSLFAGRSIRVTAKADGTFSFEDKNGPMPKKPAGVPVN